MSEQPMGLPVPWWAKAISWIVAIIPAPLLGPLSWIKIVLPLVIKIIESIPDKDARKEAISELKQSVKDAKKTGDWTGVEGVMKKHCEGVGCPTPTQSL